ncbi:hypothetical protein CFP56_031063 [Quercus suber]|uniref:Uncharacterized protein n=1 Tax=Quercus suber TaxID=58331 RepID=A0AAW0LVP7_QUESU
MRIPGVVGKSTEFNVDIFSSETGKWSQSASVCATDCLVGFNPYTGKCCQFFDKPVDLNRSYGIFERLWVFHEKREANRRVKHRTLCQDESGAGVASLVLSCLKDHDKGGKWYLKHKVYLRDLEKSPCLTELLRVDMIVEVLAYHPNDGEIMYLMIETKVVSCNLRRKTPKVVLDSPKTNDLCSDYNVFNFLLPCWPTPIPHQMEKAA